MRKIYLILLLTLVSLSPLLAQSVSVTASAPSVVEEGETFSLQYVVNDRADGIELGSFDGFYVMGPSTSYSTSSSWVNGKSTKSSTFTYTYILTALEVGSFVIPPATVRVDGKSYQSNSLSIEVLAGSGASTGGANGTGSGSNGGSNGSGEAGNAGGSTGAGGSGNAGGSGGAGSVAGGGAGGGNSAGVATESPGSEVNASTLFVRTEISTSSLYVGESMVATLKLYVSPQVRLTNLGHFQPPSFEGFLSREIDDQKNIELVRGSYNGKVYNVAEISKVLLSPQQAGEIVIEPFELECIVREQSNAPRSIFDDFFDNYKERTLLRRSAPVTITVKELPSEGRPSDFSGVVGAISAMASISADSVVANDAITYTLEVTGSGNLDLMKAPTLNFPYEFESYPPKVTRNVKSSASGSRGKVTYEYLLIPRAAGEYEIPAATISYFSTSSHRYEAATTSPFTIKVGKGSATGSDDDLVRSFKKEELRQVGEDIRYIKTGDLHLKPTGRYYFASISYYLSFVVPLLLILVGGLYYRRRIAAAADLVRVRERSANKMARGRMKLAERAMKANDAERFYLETLSALWGYVSYKLNVDRAELTRDNICDILEKRSVSREHIDSFISILDSCEYAHYAPGSGSDTEMEKIYRSGIDIITSLDKAIK